MIRISGTNKTRQATPAKKSAGASASFKPSNTPDVNAGAAHNIDQATPTDVMSALISLQSDGGGNAKTLVAAQRILDLLDALRMRVLDGQANEADIEALSMAARARAHAAAEPGLQDIYDEIALRARVELAKLGQ